MNFWLNIGILVSIALTIITFIIIVVIRFSRDDEDFQDLPFGINFMSNFTDNVAFGVEKKIITGKEGRKIITLSSRDVSPSNIHKIKDVEVIVEKNKIITLPKGNWSGEKNINIYLPPTAESFPDAIKETELGKALMMVTEIKNSINSELDCVQEGSKRKSEILKRLGDGELSQEHLIKVDELQKDLIRIATDVKNKEKPSYNPISSSGQT